MLSPEWAQWVAVRAGRVVGLGRVQFSADGARAGLGLLLVAPDARRQGVGRALHDRLLEDARARGIARMQIGGGGPAYFWPGAPQNLPDARPFFALRGWDFSETAYDLTRDLSDYVTPPGLMARATGYQIRPVASAAEADALLRFEAAHFPDWHDFYARAAARGQYHNLLAAWDAAGAVAGALLLFSARESYSADPSVIWGTLLGAEMGGLGAVGVAEFAREAGLGTALVAEGCALLRARGVRHAHIGWTVLLSFYGRLGFTPWRTYDLAWRDL